MYSLGEWVIPEADTGDASEIRLTKPPGMF